MEMKIEKEIPPVVVPINEGKNPDMQHQNSSSPWFDSEFSITRWVLLVLVFWLLGINLARLSN